MTRMENTSDGHKKFYEIYFDWGKVVSIRYGAIDTPGTIIKKSFSTIVDASSWTEKQAREKQAAGYKIVDHNAEYWHRMYSEASRKLSSIRSAVW